MKKQDNKQEFSLISKNNFSIYLISICSLGYGIYYGLLNNLSQLDSAIATIILTICMFYSATKIQPKKVGIVEDIIGYLFLAVAFFMIIFQNSQFGENLSFLFLAFSGFLLFSGFKVFKSFVLPLFFAFIILPFQDYIFLKLSYPVRLISTKFSVAILNFFNIEILSKGTSIYLNNATIAITDACSGLSQLGVLALIYYFYIKKYKMNGIQILFYLSLIYPIILIANTIRLIITILLFFVIKHQVFNDLWHTSLGYVFLLLTLLFAYLSTKLFDFTKTQKENK